MTLMLMGEHGQEIITARRSQVSVYRQVQDGKTGQVVRPGQIDADQSELAQGLAQSWCGYYQGSQPQPNQRREEDSDDKPYKKAAWELVHALAHWNVPLFDALIDRNRLL